MFFIAAPFGNYLKFKDIISVSGTWTLKSRPGRFMQVLKTLRYTKHGWVNRLGLRNKGIDYGLKYPKDVLSIAAIEPDDWYKLYKKIPKNVNVEINLGCPNTPKNLFPGIEYFTKNRREWCIAKIPPTFEKSEIDYIIKAGFKQIHACNTIPTLQGGLSGKDIVPHTLRVLKYIKRYYPEIQVIAGGGIYSKEDIQRYKDNGADHFSLGTVCFSPWKIKGLYK
tara:strand:- start:2801 stop:3469 length:669 start_codon:yes stop_codon:yes gene_type:complete